MCLREKIGPDPRNFNQRVSLGRNDLLIRTFPSAIELAITAMEDLINDYDREHTKFADVIRGRVMQVRCGRCSKFTRH
jgi:hypothetical protein